MKVDGCVECPDCHRCMACERCMKADRGTRSGWIYAWDVDRKGSAHHRSSHTTQEKR